MKRIALIFLWTLTVAGLTNDIRRDRQDQSLAGSRAAAQTLSQSWLTAWSRGTPPGPESLLPLSAVPGLRQAVLRDDSGGVLARLVADGPDPAETTRLILQQEGRPLGSLALALQPPASEARLLLLAALAWAAPGLVWALVRRQRPRRAAEPPATQGQMRKQLARAEERYRNLYEHARDLVCSVDGRGRALSVNRAFLDLVQWSEQDLIGQPLSAIVRPESLSLWQEQLQRSMVGDPQPFECDLLTRDGRALTIEGCFRPNSGELSCPSLTGIFRDMTLEREAELKLRQAQKMEAIGRVAGGIAHDFNNLLSVILSCADLGNEMQDDRETLNECLDTIQRTVRKGAELTRQLLIFSRRQDSKRENLDLDGVAQSMIKLASRLLGEDIALNCRLESGLCVFADRSELDQVLLNLIVNARDAMPGGGTLKITTRPVLHEGQPGVRLVVEDNGVGIDPGNLGSIFDPYFTTKEPGRGTGLGLSTTYAIVQKMGGRIEVQSQPGQGTAFTIDLPVTDSQGQGSSGASMVRPQPGKESILLVEDETSLCQSTCRYLRHFGYQVVSAPNASEALQLLERPGYRPDLLLTDVVLPGMSGLELARRTRQKQPNLPILFVSGYQKEGRLQDRPPGSSFLAKPYRASDLTRHVRSLLDCPSPC